MTFIERVAAVVRESGPTGALRRYASEAYRRGLRPLLPVVGPVRYGGVAVAVGDGHRFGDGVLPAGWVPDVNEDVPEYEAALLEGLRRHARPGDRVVVVGGGVGATAAFAALQVGPTGRVTCFEGARERIATVQRTAALNGVAERLDVRHAVVARALAVWGTAPDSAVVEPADLPACDVLELDCEGAEVNILREMTIEPRAILVETHGVYGAPTPTVTALLRERGYRTEELGVAEPRLREYCEEHDIRVVAAARAG